MLKVVGASWQKTRVGTYILIGAGLLVIGAFFVVYIDRPTYDGTYCATAFWSKEIGFQIEYWKQQNDLLNIPKGAARICYKDSIFKNGWAQIEVETQRTHPDWVQAYGAGMLEGSLTWNNIYNQWQNTIEASCERDDDSRIFCEWLRDLLTTNYEKSKKHAEKLAENDHYWHQISLFFKQLEGLETGYMRGAKRARSDLEEEIPFSDFLLLNSAADIQDLRIYYENNIKPLSLSSMESNGNNNENEINSELQINSDNNDTTKTSSLADSDKLRNTNFDLPSAIMLTKIFQTDSNSTSWKLLFGHSTAGSYASMLRIQKRYKFRYHFSPNPRSNTVPGVDITFTGYPGILGSTDDFYIVKGRQVQSIVAGVSLKYRNMALWQTVNVHESIPLAARVMAANRIAQNRRTWSKAMERQPYTGCKQWITVDLNKLSPQGNLFVTLAEDEKHDDAGLTLNAVDEAAINERQNRFKGLVWIAEQLPGHMHYKDVSDQYLLKGHTAWVARGTPYLEKIQLLDGSIATRIPENEQEQGEAQQEGSEEENESGHLNPAANAEILNLEAVDSYLRKHGFRGDLLGDKSVAYGNIDIKLYSYNTRVGMSDYHAFAGPIYMRSQYMQPRAVNTLPASSMSTGEPTTMPSQNDESQKLNSNDKAVKVQEQNEIVASALQDDRLSVIIDDAGELSELERISERRSVRNDMRAIALRRSHDRAPFKWSDAQIADIGHHGQPDTWNFEHVSPLWSW